MLGLKYPIIQAPIAAAATPKLIATVSNCGALGSVAAGYLPANDLHTLILETKKLTPKPFQVNLFVPSPVHPDQNKIAQMLLALAPLEAKLGLIDIDHPITIPPFEAQVEVVLREAIPIVSFTFGIPEVQFLQELKKRKVFIMGTATTVAEAEAWEAAGADAVVAQGFEAGGHRGSFLKPALDSLIGLIALVPQIVDAIKLPVIAAGGIMDHRGFQAAKALGAIAVQMGTAFLITEENTVAPAYQTALLQAIETDTTLTCAFSGKYARGLRNAFSQNWQGHETEIPEYPIQHYLTTPMRKAASQQGVRDYMNMWTGQGLRLGKRQTVQALIESLMRGGS